MTFNGNVYYIRRLQTSGSGTFVDDTVNNGGEPGTETFQTRLDVTHDIGRLSHTIQWFRKSASVENVDDGAPLDEEPDYFRPEQNYFNYNIAYEVTDNITARLVVNNLTNTQYLRDLYIPSQYDNGVGRSFIFAVNARF
jgi:outer membrane receptor protein involved in Fe transport